MLDLTLTTSSLGASVAGGIFLAVGINLRQRRVPADGERAMQLFTIWWVGLSIFAVAGASMDLTMALGIEPFHVLLALHYARVIALCIGLWGLMYYVAYVLTGRSGLMLPLALFYSFYYAVILFLVTAGGPQGLVAEPWPRLELAKPILDAAGAGVLLTVPPLVAALTYLLLYAKAGSLTRRLRILLVSLGTGVWFAGVAVREANLAAAWMPLVVGILAAWAVSWAYEPPAWVRRRLDAAEA